MSPSPPAAKVAELEARIATVKEEIASKTARLKEVERERLKEIQLRLRRARSMLSRPRNGSAGPAVSS